jgi:hypothetical protein
VSGQKRSKLCIRDGWGVGNELENDRKTETDTTDIALPWVSHAPKDLTSQRALSLGSGNPRYFSTGKQRVNNFLNASLSMDDD